MALKDLSFNDLTFFRTYSKNMQSCHEKEFLKVVDPDLVRSFYRGKNKKKEERGLYQDQNSREHYLVYSRIFQSTNTILPNLYYQNPRIMAVPPRKGDVQSAALMTALLNYYMKQNKQKEENQDAVLNTWFFGLGWKKMGYRTTFMQSEQEPSIEAQGQSQGQGGFFDKVKQGFSNFLGNKPDAIAPGASHELIDTEGTLKTS